MQRAQKEIKQNESHANSRGDDCGDIYSDNVQSMGNVRAHGKRATVGTPFRLQRVHRDDQGLRIGGDCERLKEARAKDSTEACA